MLSPPSKNGLILRQYTASQSPKGDYNQHNKKEHPCQPHHLFKNVLPPVQQLALDGEVRPF